VAGRSQVQILSPRSEKSLHLAWFSRLKGLGDTKEDTYAHELACARRTRPSTRYALTPRPPALLLGYGRIATPAIEAGV
jgi:hypothetical protein